MAAIDIARNTINTFIDFSLLPLQSSGNKYGPVAGDTTTKFRAGGKFTITTTSFAYAVCDGIVLVQPQDGSTTKANLILRPNMGLNNGFPEVKYFIYRGLVLSDFIINTGSTIDLAVSGTSAYINQIREGNTSTGFSPFRIGYDLFSALADFSLDAAFNEERSTGGQPIVLANIKQGQTLGRFSSADGGNISFDVVMNDRNSFLKLSDVRAADNIIEVPIPGGTTDLFVTGLMSKRERALAFMDPAVLYMNYGLDSALGVVNISGSTPVTYTGLSSVYDNIVSKFQTKNRIYIDLRNEFGYSLNYAKDNQGLDGTEGADFGNNIKLGIGASDMDPTSAAIPFYTDYWPLHIIDSTTYSDTTSFVPISFKFWKTFNPRPAVYADHAFTKEGTLIRFDKFQRDDSYSSSPSTPAITGNWSDPFTYYFPRRSAGVQSIAFYVKLYVNRTLIPDDVPVSAFKKGHYLDNLFGPMLPINKIKKIGSTKPVQWYTGLGKRYMNTGDYFSTHNVDDFYEGMVDIGACILDNGTADSAITFYVIPIDLNHVQISSQERNLKLIMNANIEHSGLQSYRQAGTSSKDIDLYLNSLLPSFNPEEPGVPGAEFYQYKFHKYPITIPGTSTPVTVPVGTADFNSNSKSFRFSLTVTLGEYTSNILPAAATLSGDYHDAYFKFDDINEFSATSASSGTYPDLFVQNCALKISGYNSSGAYAVTNPIGGIAIGAISADDRNYYSFAHEHRLPDISSRPDPIIPVADFISLVKGVEKTYKHKDTYAPATAPPAQEWRNTACRIRAHSYGYVAPNPWSTDLIQMLTQFGVNHALANAVPDTPQIFLNPGNNQLEKRHLDAFFDAGRTRLTARSDENTIGDNPGPYVKVPKHPSSSVFDLVDMGQILYGFESLVSKSETTRTIGSNYYNIFYIVDPLDLTSFIANIATPIATLFAYEKKVADNQKIELAMPKELVPPISVGEHALLDRFYEISSPDADLLGNADGFGLFQARQKINSNTFKLSELLDLYYNGTAGTLPLHPSSPALYKCTDRWLMVCLYFNIAEIDATDPNIIHWLPSRYYSTADTGIAEWLPHHSVSGTPASRKDYYLLRRDTLLKKCRIFTHFWLSRLVAPKPTGLSIASNPRPSPSPTDVYDPAMVDPPMPLLTPPLALRVDGLTDYILANKFFPFLKSRLIAEQGPTKTVTP